MTNETIEPIEELEIEAPGEMQEELLDEEPALASTDNMGTPQSSTDEIAFKECLKFSNAVGCLELYSCSTPVADLANIGLQFLAIQKEDRKKPNYTG
jgi:hypothetical protein